MQSQQMANMAGMNANVRGPDGTPIMGNMQRPVLPQNNPDPRERLNTYIYDYFLRNNHTQLAQVMMECKLPMSLKSQASKPSPSGRNANGVDAMDKDSRDGLPEPNLPEGQLADNSFLLDWWAQFWDIYMAARKQQPNEKGTQYIAHTRVRLVSHCRWSNANGPSESHPNAQRPAEPALVHGQHRHGYGPVSEHDARNPKWR
jgi:hypothetical protein